MHFDIDPWTRLVFITALDQYREEAFSVYACDYIVKPFKMDRLRQTLDRLCSGPAAGRELSGLSHLSDTLADTIRLFHTESKMVLLELKNILFITREGRRTVIYHTNGLLETNEHLQTLSEELGGYPFMRTQRASSLT
ncbi:MAG: LytTR family transcriptional regulator DNA-binding domain-containing protein [Bacillota bacterium]